MEFFSKPSFELYGGWWLILFYLIINFGIALLKKGVLQRLMAPVKQAKTLRDRILYWIGQLSWGGTIIYPIFFPIKNGTIFFYFGITLYLIGMVFTAVALLNYASTPLGQPVIKGLYRFSRNPIYVAYTLVGYGIGLLIGSWFLMILHTIEIISCHFMILDEEKFCIEKYGTDYQKHLKDVPRYLGPL